MNQILNTKLEQKHDHSLKKETWFKFQFCISLLVFLLTISFGFFYIYDLHKKEKNSNYLLSNYSIYKLYHNTSSSQNVVNSEISHGLFRNYRDTKNQYLLPYFLLSFRRNSSSFSL